MSNADSSTCDECGRQPTKIHRVYRGTRYCGTCYARLFKPLPCPRCGNQARLLKTDPDAICSPCENSQPCARCGRSEYEIGKITPYGPVCKSCGHYFVEPSKCEACGALSRTLTRVGRLSHDLRLCPKCARSDRGTCQACRRYRTLTAAPTGQNLCAKCLKHGQVRCQSCGHLMPAGRGKHCEDCYWTRTFSRRLAINVTAFSSSTMRSTFRDFGNWLLNRVGPNKAAITVNRYLPFFLEIEKLWGGLPLYDDLLHHYGAEGLRRVRLPMKWLQNHRGLRVDVKLKIEDSEWRQIDAIMKSVPLDSTASKCLGDYKDYLITRMESRGSTLRSVRLALRPAASLLSAEPSGDKPPTQEALDGYLLKKPGQKAAVTGFLTFLKNEKNLKLLPRLDPGAIKKLRRRELEKKIINMSMCQENTKNFHLLWTVLCLEYFHGVSISKKSASNISLHSSENGFYIELNGRSYFIPSWANTGNVI